MPDGPVTGIGFDQLTFGGMQVSLPAFHQLNEGGEFGGIRGVGEGGRDAGPGLPQVGRAAGLLRE